MPNDLPMKDPQKIWQDQPTEAIKMSAIELRHRAQEKRSRARFEALIPIVVGSVLCVVFAWSFVRAHTIMARAGWGLLSLWGIYAAYHAYWWIWPRGLPQDAPIEICVAFYRHELERRRDYIRNGWKKFGLPFAFLGMVMAVVGTGAPNGPPPHPWLNALPSFVLLAVWAIAFLFIKKKLGHENLEQEIEELRAFERQNRP